MSENGGGLSWFVKALIGVGAVAILTGVLLPMLIDSPVWPEGSWDAGGSLMERILGR